MGALNFTRFATSQSSDYNVEQIIKYPRSGTRHYYDIGLIKLARKVNFSQNVRPICLPENDILSNVYYKADHNLDINLQRNDTKEIIRYEVKDAQVWTCETVEELVYDNNTAKAKFMCILRPENSIKGQDGTYGAPVYINHAQFTCSQVQLGVWNQDIECDQLMCHPGIATKVYSFNSWLEKTIWECDDFYVG